MLKTELTLCYTPAFPYQRHFDGYVEMSEEDAALFWEIGDHPTPDPGSISIGPTLSDIAFPKAEEAASKTTIAIRPVPRDEPGYSRCMKDGPDDPRSMDVCANPADDRQDTKPADSAHTARVQEWTGAPTDDSLTPRPPCPLTTTGTLMRQLNPK